MTGLLSYLLSFLDQFPTFVALMKATGKIRIQAVLAGIVTALVIGFSQLFYFELEAPVGVDSETEQHDATSSSREESSISLPVSYSIPTSYHVVSTHEFSFIEEILFNFEEQELTPAPIRLSAGKLFQTLFQFIISPNAP